MKTTVNKNDNTQEYLKIAYLYKKDNNFRNSFDIVIAKISEKRKQNPSLFLKEVKELSDTMKKDSDFKKAFEIMTNWLKELEKENPYNLLKELLKEEF